MDGTKIIPLRRDECFSPTGRMYRRFIDWCEENPSVALMNLPFMLAEMADAIGFAPTIALAHYCGGTQIYISATPQPKRRVGDIGAPALDWLAPRYRGMRVLVPMGAPLFHAFRRAEILRAKAAGLSDQKVACAIGVHVRTVERIMKRSRPANIPIGDSRSREGRGRSPSVQKSPKSGAAR